MARSWTRSPPTLHPAALPRASLSGAAPTATLYRNDRSDRAGPPALRQPKGPPLSSPFPHKQAFLPPLPYPMIIVTIWGSEPPRGSENWGGPNCTPVVGRGTEGQCGSPKGDRRDTPQLRACAAGALQPGVSRVRFLASVRPLRVGVRIGGLELSDPF